jgi:UDP-glucose 4-epimerase
VGTVLRLGAVYGPRIKGNYLRLLQALERGLFVSIGDGCNRRTLIYDRDAARAAMLALRHPSAVGKIFNVSDGEFHPMIEIVKAMCEALGRTPPRIALPIGPVRLAAGLLEDTAGRIGRHSMIGRATIDTYTEDVAVNSQRIQNQLGFVPQFDLRAGWRETVRAMRQDSAL